MSKSIFSDKLVALRERAGLTKTSVSFDGLFVFRFGDALHIKRVTRGNSRDTIIAISDNRTLYDPIEYRMNDVDVIGRVIWYGRKV